MIKETLTGKAKYKESYTVAGPNYEKERITVTITGHDFLVVEEISRRFKCVASLTHGKHVLAVDRNNFLTSPDPMMTALVCNE